MLSEGARTRGLYVKQDVVYIWNRNVALFGMDYQDCELIFLWEGNT